mgnify:CR=1 FL=1
MIKIIGKRLLQMIVVLFISSILIFVLVRMSGTDPVSVILGGKESSQETRINVQQAFNLDKSQPEQYLIWINGIFHGKLGLSFKYQTDVSDLFAGRLSVTLGLVCMGSSFALLLAIPLGIICAVRKNSLLDKSVTIIILILNGCPAFLTSILMILVISKVNPNYPFVGSFSNIKEYFERLLLPSISLAFTMVALTMRVIRSSMIEQQNAPYTMTAVAKGVSTGRLVLKHNLKNAVIPVISVVSIQIGSMVAGAVLVENVFSLGGLGTLLVDSIKTSDYAVVQSITMFLIMLFMVLSTISDILYAVIDPRIRMD